MIAEREKLEDFDVRLEFMYNYRDYENDRYQARERFSKEVSKRTNLRDVGKLLDKFILDDKAEMFHHYTPKEDLGALPPSAKRDVDSRSLHWSAMLFQEVDPLIPRKSILF